MRKSLNFMTRLTAIHFLKSTLTVTFTSSLSKQRKLIYPINLRECSCLDFVIRREYQFLKNVLSREEIASSNHLCFLAAYYKALTFILKVHKFFSRQSKYPIVFDESTLNEEYKIFIVEYMSDCSTVGHMHKQI